jgi:hypothetical protein
LDRYHVDPAVRPLLKQHPGGVMDVRRGDAVVVAQAGRSWWIGRVISIRGGARNPKVCDSLQVFDVDTGAVDWIHAAEAVPLEG